MTLPEAYELFEYWRSSPPENEMLALLAQVFTTWEPQDKVPMSEAQQQAAHRASLEKRWAAGAMNIKQFFEATGGRAMGVGGAPGGKPIDPKNPPGIGPFPGAH